MTLAQISGSLMKNPQFLRPQFEGRIVQMFKVLRYKNGLYFLHSLRSVFIYFKQCCFFVYLKASNMSQISKRKNVSETELFGDGRTI